MKKTIVLLLTVVCLFLLSSCGANEEYAPLETFLNEKETLEDPQLEINQLNYLNVSELSHYNGIPAWLLTGIEVYQSGVSQTMIDAALWYAEATAKGLPTLSDEWFIPGFIDDELSEDVNSVAYAFIRFLSKTGELERLITLYKRNITPWYEAESWNATQARIAEQRRAELWADFTGSEVNVQDVIFQYTFGDLQELTGLGAMEIEFNALAQSGWYFFTASEWPRDVVEHYISVSEESFRFIGDFLNYHPYEPIISVYKAPPQIPDFGLSAGGRYWSDIGRYRTIDTRGSVGNPIFLLVHAHEAAHALLELTPHISRSNIPSPPEIFMLDGLNPTIEFGQLAFEEGFCVLLQYLFLAYTENDRTAEEIAKSFIFSTLNGLNIELFEIPLLQEIPAYIAYNIVGSLDSFEEFVAFVEEFIFGIYSEDEDIMTSSDFQRRATKEEITMYVHFTAFQTLAGRMNQFAFLYDFHSALASDVPYAALYDHYTSASFFFYLLEHRGTREDFLRVYQDIYQMEEVYGIGLEDMISEWRSYLDNLFDEWTRATADMGISETEIWFDTFFARYEEWFNQLWIE